MLDGAEGHTGQDLLEKPLQRLLSASQWFLGNRKTKTLGEVSALIWFKVYPCDARIIC